MHDSWKYIYDGLHDVKELYQLEVDPDEQFNVLGHYPEVAKRYEKVMSKHLLEIAERSKNVKLPELYLDDEIQERLRALGYI